MHPPSSSVRVLQAKVTIYQQKFVPVVIRRVGHVDIAYNKQTKNKKPFRSKKSGQTCRIESSDTCLATYAQTNVVLLCFGGSDSNLAAA